MPSPSVVLSRLRAQHPGARYELDFTTPLELLVATILAAQCTDERVNRVTPALFRRYRTAAEYAGAEAAELEELVKSTGFYRNKAKAIQGACRVLVERFGGQVPRTMDELLVLPGVARKTANVVLTTAFGLPSGIIVDTHVARVSRRLGLTRQDDPDAIEADLMRALPQEAWTSFGPVMVLHGRYTCTARAPKCGACVLEDVCEKNLDGAAPSDEHAQGAGAKGRRATSEGEEGEMAASRGTKGSAGGASSAAKGRAKGAVGKSEGAGDGAGARVSAGAASGAASGGALAEHIPPSWRSLLADEIHKPYFAELERFLADERRDHQVFPPEDEVFSALAATPYERVSVVILGQDPYHDDGQAHGLSFSVRPGVRPPPSLVNIFLELEKDLGIERPKQGYLMPWAEQGVLLLNAVLTVRAHSPNSHKNRGWEEFTDAVLRKVNERSERVVFVLWGSYAQKKEKLIDAGRHAIVKGVHPSPLSAKSGFFGSKPFSAVNAALAAAGRPPIDWRLPVR